MTVVLAYYGGLSLVTFGLYVADKAAARRQGARIAERTLQGWTWAGGFAGAIAGQALLRHKTRHPGIVLGAWFALLLHLGAWAWWLSAAGRSG
ncbi:MAG: DUF1294 domain-containing protein [Verrucomicrobia bacterium]|nr:DUF1294 domain-containing protein [Verrucomicrobiota bacterium]